MTASTTLLVCVDRCYQCVAHPYAWRKRLTRLAELGELAADLRLDRVAEQRAAVLGQELDGRAALGEARDTAISLTRNRVAVLGGSRSDSVTLPLNFAFTGPILVVATA